MKKTINYRLIAEYLGKSENTIKGWNKKSPNLLELVKFGMLCKINDLDEQKISKMIEMQEIFREKKII